MKRIHVPISNIIYSEQSLFIYYVYTILKIQTSYMMFESWD